MQPGGGASALNQHPPQLATYSRGRKSLEWAGVVNRMRSEIPLRQPEKGMGLRGDNPGSTHTMCPADCPEWRAGGCPELQGGFIPSFPKRQPLKAAGQGAAKGKLGRWDWPSQAVVDGGGEQGRRTEGKLLESSAGKNGSSEFRDKLGPERVLERRPQFKSHYQGRFLGSKQEGLHGNHQTLPLGNCPRWPLSRIFRHSLEPLG